MMIAMSASVNAFAAESNLDGENRQTDIGVYARYIDNTQWNTVPVDDNGRGTTTLPDGTEITVSGALKPGWQLVIDPITETDAENWISGILDGKAKDLAPFHIYFNRREWKPQDVRRRDRHRQAAEEADQPCSVLPGQRRQDLRSDCHRKGRLSHLYHSKPN